MTTHKQRFLSKGLPVCGIGPCFWPCELEATKEEKNHGQFHAPSSADKAEPDADRSNPIVLSLRRQYDVLHLLCCLTFEYGNKRLHILVDMAHLSDFPVGGGGGGSRGGVEGLYNGVRAMITEVRRSFSPHLLMITDCGSILTLERK